MSKSIAAVLRDAALGPKRGVFLSEWLPSGSAATEDAFMFAYGRLSFAFEFNWLWDEEKRMFLLFCAYAAEDEE